MTVTVVFDDERRRVDAWYAAYIESDGNAEIAQEAERNEITLLRKERDEADERNRLAFEQLVRQGEQIKKQREIEAAKNGHSILGATGSNGVYNPYTLEEVIPVPEHPELKEIRERRLNEILSKNDENEPENVPKALPESSPPPPPQSATPVEQVIEAPAVEPVKWTKFQITEADEEDDEKTPQEEHLSSLEDPLQVGKEEIGIDDINLSLDEDISSSASGEGRAVAQAEQTTDLYELD